MATVITRSSSKKRPFRSIETNTDYLVIIPDQKETMNKPQNSPLSSPVKKKMKTLPLPPCAPKVEKIEEQVRRERVATIVDTNTDYLVIIPSQQETTSKAQNSPLSSPVRKKMKPLPPTPNDEENEESVSDERVARVVDTNTDYLVIIPSKQPTKQTRRPPVSFTPYLEQSRRPPVSCTPARKAKANVLTPISPNVPSKKETPGKKRKSVVVLGYCSLTKKEFGDRIKACLALEKFTAQRTCIEMEMDVYFFRSFFGNRVQVITPDVYDERTPVVVAELSNREAGEIFGVSKIKNGGTRAETVHLARMVVVFYPAPMKAQAWVTI